MNSEQLRGVQAPLKEQYRAAPESARCTLAASGVLDAGPIECHVDAQNGPVTMGLHPLTGGDRSAGCSAEALLEALAGCAGVTLCAVATAMGLTIDGGEVHAEGDWDARGTLGVDREAPVGLTGLRVEFLLQTSADDAALDKLAKVTERYCVVAQTLKDGCRVTVRRSGTQ